MTAPRTCEKCGAHLDAGEVCECEKAEAINVEPSTEFVMGRSLEALPATIDFNFEALKLGLSQSLAKYDGLVVTEDDIKGAKDDRAKLNKLREALEAKRKEVKRECMAPYNDFEAKVKELVALVDKPILAIDTQLKDYEDRRREEKQAAIREIYEETVGELRDILPFEKAWRDEWYNVSVSLKKVREALVAMEGKVASDLEALSTVESEFIDAVKIKYMEGFDLSAALTERKRLQDEAEKLRQYNARKAAFEKLAAAAPPKEEAPAPVQEGAQTLEPGGGADVEQHGPAPEEEKFYILRFECTVTRTNAAELSAWLKAHNIDYRRI